MTANIPEFGRDGSDELQAQVSKDAVLFADSMLKSGARCEHVWHRRSFKDRESIIAGYWAIRSTEKYGGGALAIPCRPLNDNPYWASDRMREGRHLGLGIASTLQTIALENGRRQTLEPYALIIQQTGQLNRLLGQPGLEEAGLNAGTQNVRIEEFIAPEMDIDHSQDARRAVYAAWLADLELARAHYAA